MNPISPKVIAAVAAVILFLIGLSVVAAQAGIDLSEPITAGVTTIIGAVVTFVASFLTTDPKREVGP